MRKLILLLLAVVVGLPAVAFPQAKVGTSGAQFLEIGVSARAVGMGEAFLALADDASALYYNPAIAAIMDERSVVLTHVEYPAEINYEFAGFTTPVPQLVGALGVSAYYLSTNDMPVTTYSHPRGNNQTFTAQDFALAFTYAASLTDRFSIGVTGKYIAQMLADEQATGWAADVGTYYDTGYKGLRFCMLISNFGPDMKFIEETYPLPIDFKFGSAMDVIMNGQHQLTVAAQLSHPNDNLEKYNAGFEYWYNDMLALRGGVKLNYDTAKDKKSFIGGAPLWTAGAGVRLPLGGLGFTADYGYQDFGWLNEIHRFSIGFKF